MRLSASFFVSIFLLEILFVSVCRADDDDVAILEKGIKSLSRVVVTYQAVFDNKVKFVELQKAINHIDISMRGYQGTAKNRLGLVRTLNSATRFDYHRCVGPVFEWCMSINRIFDLFIPHIGATQLSNQDRDLIWSMTMNALESGLEQTNKSLELLTSVQYKTAELKNLFKTIFHDVHYDFGPGGFYGKEEATEIVKDIESALEEDITNLNKLRSVIEVANNTKIKLLVNATFRRAQFVPDIQILQKQCTKYVEWHGYYA